MSISISYDPILNDVRVAVTARGLNALSRDLRIPRLTLASALCGRARVGTLSLIAERWRALQGQGARP